MILSFISVKIVFENERNILLCFRFLCNSQCNTLFYLLNFLTAESTQLPATSCEHMTCYFGAYCIVRSGMATCECPGMECKKDQPAVCGSDGHTYLSTCHLRAHACRIQSDTVVQAFGPCADTPSVRRGSRSIVHSSRSNTIQKKFADASVDTSDSGKPDSPEPQTCVDLLPPLEYR